MVGAQPHRVLRTGAGRHVQMGGGRSVLLDRHQRWPLQWSRGQVGQVEVGAAAGAERGPDPEPAAVGGHGHAVELGPVPALAEDQGVCAGRGPDPVQTDPAVVLLLAGVQPRVQPPDVVERLAAGQPGDRRPPHPVHRPVDDLPGRHVDHVEPRVLGAVPGDLKGQQTALQGRLPGVEDGAAGRIEGLGIQQHPPGIRPGLRHHEHGLLLARVLAQPEDPAAADPGRCRAIDGGERRHLRLPPLPAGPGRPLRRVQGLLLGVPADHRVRLRVLQPAVRVGDAYPVQLVHDVLPGRAGVCVRCRSGGGGHSVLPRRGGAGVPTAAALAVASSAGPVGSPASSSRASSSRVGPPAGPPSSSAVSASGRAPRA